MAMELEDLKRSKEIVGEILPVIKDQHGNILDGFHRKRIDPNWKETVVTVDSPLHALKIRVHANVLRRSIDTSEKQEWVSEARRILKEQLGREATQREIAEIIGMSQNWVSDYDLMPNVEIGDFNIPKKPQKDFLGYNVWGFRDESWRKQIVSADPAQPDKEFYHGSTPSFVIHQLIRMFQPKTVLDSMAGVGTTGYVCKQYGIECDQFDIYPYPKFDVKEGDAETINPQKQYDLIFNHIPYLDMVRYGDGTNDLSSMNEKEFFEKMKRVFLKNYSLLTKSGVYALLVGDWRYQGKLIPITAKITLLAHECGFVLQDEAVKLTAEQKSTGLQEFRATKFGYLAQTFDMVLIFRRA